MNSQDIYNKAFEAELEKIAVSRLGGAMDVGSLMLNAASKRAGKATRYLGKSSVIPKGNKIVVPKGMKGVNINTYTPGMNKVAEFGDSFAGAALGTTAGLGAVGYGAYKFGLPVAKHAAKRSILKSGLKLGGLALAGGAAILGRKNIMSGIRRAGGLAKTHGMDDAFNSVKRYAKDSGYGKYFTNTSKVNNNVASRSAAQYV
jgi:hypothetical protein